MATLTATNPTLLDLAKASDPTGKIASVVEILNQVNEIMPDVTWQECNKTTTNLTIMRSGISQPGFRKIYGGTQPSKSTTVPVEDATGMLEGFNEIDAALADLNSNTQSYRLQQARATLEGFTQKVASSLFYADEGTVPEGFTGLAPRFNSLSAQNAENIIVGGGVGSDNGSIWLVVWSPNTCFGIVPKGSTAGWQQTDMGKVTIENVDGANGRMIAYRSHFRWDVGLAVPDWRYVVRIPNIDKSNLKVDRSSGADLPDLMYQALEQIPNLATGRPVFYMSRAMRSMWRRQMSFGTKSSTLEIANVGGQMVQSFQGVPVRRVDALNADEALVA